MARAKKAKIMSLAKFGIRRGGTGVKTRRGWAGGEYDICRSGINVCDHEKAPPPSPTQTARVSKASRKSRSIFRR